jgi:hypothetical protein
MSFDASELHDLARDLGTVPQRALPEVKKVVSKGALNVKNQIRKDFKESSSFDHIFLVNYNLNVDDTGVEAEIAPYIESEGFKNLVGIAINGGAQGGGGTVTDPLVALRAEEPRFVENIAKLTGFIFDG